MAVLTAIEQPIWEDVETKTRIRAGFVYDDDRRVVMSFPADEANEEYQQFLTLSSIEQVEVNTQDVRDKAAAQREKQIAQQAEASGQKKANTLFNAKIEAFELPVVQNASKEVKARIRKASNPLEVLAVVVMLMMKEEEQNGTDGATQ
jgi:hypothetical protein